MSTVGPKLTTLRPRVIHRRLSQPGTLKKSFNLDFPGDSSQLDLRYAFEARISQNISFQYIPLGQSPDSKLYGKW